MTTRAQMIERKLVDSLAKDRSKRANLGERQADGTILVNISGYSVGLLYALSKETGEEEDAILRRLDAAIVPADLPGRDAPSVFDEARATLDAWERLQGWNGWSDEHGAEALPRFFWSAMDRLTIAVVAESEDRSQRIR